MFDLLQERITNLVQEKQRAIIGIFGIPGSGKSTISKELQRRLRFNTVVLPMDGFHLYKSQLDELEDPAEAHRRRGAPFTFNPAGLVQVLKDISKKKVVLAPSFDHKVGDPLENQVTITEEHSVIIVEGLYLGLKDPIWREISGYLDQLWQISIPIDEAMNRVADRHVRSGICKDMQSALERANYNDRANAEYILNNSKSPNIIIDWESIILI